VLVRATGRRPLRRLLPIQWSQVCGLRVEQDVAIAERTDSELLAGREPAEFGCFYERHVGAVVSFLGRRVHVAESVFDLTAETFARAFERRDQYDPARGLAVAWLFGIARHLVIDAARRGRVADESRVRLGLEPIELDDEQLQHIEACSRVELRSALAGLPSEQRDAVIRRVVLDEPYSEIAVDFRCSEQVARKRVSRGLANLRRALEER
jgi:RNA polymerase sigma factor (sigma-70 family)